MSESINGTSMALRTDLIRNRINRKPDQNGNLDHKANTFEIVYGGDHGKKLFHKGKEMMQYSGYSIKGDSISTEGVPWFAGWSGIEIQNFKLIEHPWNNDRVKSNYQIDKSQFDYYNNPNNKYLNDGTFEDQIIQGLNVEYAGHLYREFMYNNQDFEYAGSPVYTKDAKPKIGKKWIDYVHVLQPPTYLSWGFGTIYIDNSFGITYLTIPIAPFSLQNTTDLSAKFEQLPSSALSGEKVRVGVRVNSTFVDPVTTPFAWTITSSDGRRLDSVEFTGHATTETGMLSMTKNESRMLYATFTMPEQSVRIQFHVNQDGKSPEETLLDNNALDSNPLAVRVIKPVAFDYDVLTAKVKFPLINGVPVTAKLELPRPDAYWTGNAVGEVTVTNNSTNLYHPDEFKVSNNTVNEPSESIEVRPIIQAKIHRPDFGDNPEHKKWLNPSPQSPRRDGLVSYGGSVKRPWKYEYQECNEKKECTTKTVTGTAVANFTSGTDRQVYIMHVYNGLKDLPKHEYENKIENNTESSKTKKMLWENEPYQYDVIRWMRHVDEEGNTIEGDGMVVPVPGQYDRIFTHQASADIDWKSESTIAEQYKTAREAAKQKKNKKSLYNNAVFATDRELQKYAYPVKSGYYLNPVGKYTFTVKTVMYKQSDADTQDHKDLVNTLIDSFRYETNLIYINNKKDAVNLNNKPLAKKGGGFVPVKGILTADNPKGVNGAALLKVLDRKSDEARYSKQVEEIFSSPEPTGQTHEYWKKVMEGYSESSTLGSKENYKYREYVEKGQKKMYRVTETTKVTIEINPNNIPVYTHANMQNGKYYVKAWIDDAKLNRGDHTYKRLETLKGIDVLDNIEVTVVGSMFDDLND